MKKNQKSLEKIIEYIREQLVGMPTNNATSGNVAGLPPDTPPVKKKRKPTPLGRYRTRVNWKKKDETK